MNTKIILINEGNGLKSITENSIETSAEHYTWGLSTLAGLYSKLKHEFVVHLLLHINFSC